MADIVFTEITVELDPQVEARIAEADADTKVDAYGADQAAIEADVNFDADRDRYRAELSALPLVALLG